MCLTEQSEIGKMPDAIWNGRYWEFKAPSTKRAIDDRMRKGVHQLRDAISRTGRKNIDCGMVIDITQRKISLSDAVDCIIQTTATRCAPRMEVIIKDGDHLILWIKKIDV